MVTSLDRLGVDCGGGRSVECHVLCHGHHLVQQSALITPIRTVTRATVVDTRTGKTTAARLHLNVGTGVSGISNIVVVM